MPLLKLETTVVLSEDKRKALLASLSKTVAETIGKPEQYVMVTIGQAERLKARRRLSRVSGKSMNRFNVTIYSGDCYIGSNRSESCPDEFFDHTSFAATALVVRHIR